jgi:redox-sensing transcriptional repressor
MTPQNKKIPRMSLERLPIYYRTLCNLADAGYLRIKSAQLGRIIQLEATTIRRDFSYFGDLGKSGYGYDIAHLIEIFGTILEVNHTQGLALIGVGNLGRALLINNFRRNPNLEIVAAYDVDPAVIGGIINEVPIQALADLEDDLKAKQIKGVISTVPSHALQEVVDQLVMFGVTSILSFAPEPVHVPESVHVRYLDLTSEVQNLLLLAELS